MLTGGADFSRSVSNSFSFTNACGCSLSASNSHLLKWVLPHCYSLLPLIWGSCLVLKSCSAKDGDTKTKAVDLGNTNALGLQQAQLPCKVDNFPIALRHYKTFTNGHRYAENTAAATQQAACELVGEWTRWLLMASECWSWGTQICSHSSSKNILGFIGRWEISSPCY